MPGWHDGSVPREGGITTAGRICFRHDYQVCPSWAAQPIHVANCTGGFLLYSFPAGVASPQLQSWSGGGARVCTTNVAPTLNVAPPQCRNYATIFDQQITELPGNS
jgi:hypothetical protein